MSEQIPIFKAENFCFDEQVPSHDEPALAGAIISGDFALGFAPKGESSLLRNGKMVVKILAVNIPDMGMVRRLASARIAQQEPVIKAYGRSDDLYAFFPGGKILRVYDGWGTGDPYTMGGSSMRILPD